MEGLRTLMTRAEHLRLRHESFRSFCIGFAQTMYRTEVKMRTNLLGEPAKHVRPLSETRLAIFLRVLMPLM